MAVQDFTNPLFFDWLGEMELERQEPVLRIIEQQLREMKVGNVQANNCFLQLARSKMTVSLRRIGVLKENRSNNTMRVSGVNNNVHHKKRTNFHKKKQKEKEEKRIKRHYQEQHLHGNICSNPKEHKKLIVQEERERLKHSENHSNSNSLSKGKNQQSLLKEKSQPSSNRVQDERERLKHPKNHPSTNSLFKEKNHQSLLKEKSQSSSDSRVQAERERLKHSKNHQGSNTSSKEKNQQSLFLNLFGQPFPDSIQEESEQLKHPTNLPSSNFSSKGKNQQSLLKEKGQPSFDRVQEEKEQLKHPKNHPSSNFPSKEKNQQSLLKEKSQPSSDRVQAERERLKHSKNHQSSNSSSKEKNKQSFLKEKCQPFPDSVQEESEQLKHPTNFSNSNFSSKGKNQQSLLKEKGQPSFDRQSKSSEKKNQTEKSCPSLEHKPKKDVMRPEDVRELVSNSKEDEVVLKEGQVDNTVSRKLPIDYKRDTPSLTPSEVDRQWETLSMTPPRKTASPLWSCPTTGAKIAGGTLKPSKNHPSSSSLPKKKNQSRSERRKPDEVRELASHSKEGKVATKEGQAVSSTLPIDYTRDTPSLTPSEVDRCWETFMMTPPRKTASPVWRCPSPRGATVDDGWYRPIALVQASELCTSPICCEPITELVEAVKIDRSDHDSEEVVSFSHTASCSTVELGVKEESRSNNRSCEDNLERLFSGLAPDNPRMISEVSNEQTSIAVVSDSCTEQSPVRGTKQGQLAGSDKGKRKENSSNDLELFTGTPLLNLVPEMNKVTFKLRKTNEHSEECASTSALKSNPEESSNETMHQSFNKLEDDLDSIWQKFSRQRKEEVLKLLGSNTSNNDPIKGQLIRKLSVESENENLHDRNELTSEDMRMSSLAERPKEMHKEHRTDSKNSSSNQDIAKVATDETVSVVRKMSESQDVECNAEDDVHSISSMSTVAYQGIKNKESSSVSVEKCSTGNNPTLHPAAFNKKHNGPPCSIRPPHHFNRSNFLRSPSHPDFRHKSVRGKHFRRHFSRFTIFRSSPNANNSFSDRMHNDRGHSYTQQNRGYRAHYVPRPNRYCDRYDSFRDQRWEDNSMPAPRSAALPVWKSTPQGPDDRLLYQSTAPAETSITQIAPEYLEKQVKEAIVKVIFNNESAILKAKVENLVLELAGKVKTERSGHNSEALIDKKQHAASDGVELLSEIKQESYDSDARSDEVMLDVADEERPLYNLIPSVAEEERVVQSQMAVGNDLCDEQSSFDRNNKQSKRKETTANGSEIVTPLLDLVPKINKLPSTTKRKNAHSVEYASTSALERGPMVFYREPSYPSSKKIKSVELDLIWNKLSKQQKEEMLDQLIPKGQESNSGSSNGQPSRMRLVKNKRNSNSNNVNFYKNRQSNNKEVLIMDKRVTEIGNGDMRNINSLNRPAMATKEVNDFAFSLEPQVVERCTEDDSVSIASVSTVAYTSGRNAEISSSSIVSLSTSNNPALYSSPIHSNRNVRPWSENVPHSFSQRDAFRPSSPPVSRRIPDHCHSHRRNYQSTGFRDFQNTYPSRIFPRHFEGMGAPFPDYD